MHYLKRAIRVIIYEFSKERRQLNAYMKMFRNLEKLSESEVEKFRQLALNEKAIYGKS